MLEFSGLDKLFEGYNPQKILSNYHILSKMFFSLNRKEYLGQNVIIAENI